ncbi:fluoride efflux transporter CrcB [Olsenella urininfantis]|uniref:fluoride efflux transporter CrcB n=1 Tax=Olsenella urininfantis TaxID=1871033 RepID=UPI000985A85B|nr:fluoride efflux transporter CrcB [Olsenella urininfantis]
MDLLAVGLGGLLGSVGRWRLGVWLSDLLPGLPAGTLVANVLAALLIGFVGGLGLAGGMPERQRLFWAVGLCGGLSTFSTFSSETLQLLLAGSWAGALGNVTANLLSCLLAVAAGMCLARLVSA